MSHTDNPTIRDIHSPFGKAWRGYVRDTSFAALPSHDQALIRLAFVSGWRAAIVSLEDDIWDGRWRTLGDRISELNAAVEDARRHGVSVRFGITSYTGRDGPGFTKVSQLTIMRPGDRLNGIPDVEL